MDKREEIQEEAYQAIKNKWRGTLGVSPRVGKTRIAIRLIEDIINKDTNSGIIVVAPRLSIIKAWKEEIKLLGKEHLLENIKFMTYLSFNKFPLLAYADLIVLDEVQALSIRKDLDLSLYRGRIIGLTGTPPKNKTSDNYKMMAKYCPVVYSYLTEEAVEDKVLNNYQILVHLIEIDKNKNIKKINKKTGGVYYQSEENIYNFWSRKIWDSLTSKEKSMNAIYRMKAIHKFPSKTIYAKKLLKDLDERCIIFANTTDQADEITPFSYHSKNKDSEINLQLFKEGATDKLSCVGQLSEGITFVGLNTALVLNSFGNERSFLQRFSRVLNLPIDEFATIHVLTYKNSVDVDWIKSATADLDPSKIKYVEFKL